MGRSAKSSEHPNPDINSLRRRVDELETSLANYERRVEELETSKERFRRVFEHSNDAIFIVDPTVDEIIDCNPRACQMLGFSREELLSTPVSAIHPHEMPKLKAFAQSVFKKEQGWTDELTCLTKGGETLAAEISASVVELDGRTCMIAMVRDVSERNRLAQEIDFLCTEIRADRNLGAIIGSSPPLKKVLQQIEMVAPTDANVLITGESGTGKELVAAAIHDNSGRRGRSMVAVNCASIPAELFESEFFGHMKGSFTGALKDRVGRFELAHGSTLFLDEIGEIPLTLQGKLLRVLQEGKFERVGEERTRKVDVRILAATNRDPLVESEAGRFRQDLYYRLSVFPIEVPPLRDRHVDIGPLTEHFVKQSSARLGLPRPPLTREDINILEKYSWPGNIRELQNVVERAIILGRGGRVQFEGLLATESGTSRGPPGSTDPSSVDSLTLVDLERMEREVILAALKRSSWKIYGKNGAAALLGLKPTTLRSRMKKMGIHSPLQPESP